MTQGKKTMPVAADRSAGRVPAWQGTKAETDAKRAEKASARATAVAKATPARQGEEKEGKAPAAPCKKDARRGGARTAATKTKAQVTTKAMLKQGAKAERKTKEAGKATPLRLPLPPDFDLVQIAESGQCFRMRWSADEDGTIHAVVPAGRRVLRIAQEKDALIVSCTEEEWAAVWSPYFDLDTDYGAMKRRIPRKDRFLTAAAKEMGGIRILRQDYWEMLVSFLISQNNNIPRIRASVEALCRACGPKIPVDGTVYYGFPSPAELRRMTLSELQAAGLGYRARYLYRLCRAPLPAPTEQELLNTLGVGQKVADCVLLFGCHQMERYPVDTWVKKLLEQVYGGSFDRARYASFAGYIQQLQFAYYRTAGGEQIWKKRS